MTTERLQRTFHRFGFEHVAREGAIERKDDMAMIGTLHHVHMLRHALLGTSFTGLADTESDGHPPVASGAEARPPRREGQRGGRVTGRWGAEHQRRKASVT
jgi:hypothetical protein